MDRKIADGGSGGELVLVGGGGHCRSVIDAAESAGFIIKGVLDRPELIGSEVLSTRVIGGDDSIPEFVGSARFIITVGAINDFSLRSRLHDLVKEAGGEFATVIASTARVSPYAQIGKGTVVLHHASVNACARIGEGCIINTAANVDHDAEIGDQTHVSTGAMVNGGVKIGKRCFIGSGAVIAQGISICDDAIIPAGMVVKHNITKSGIYRGIMMKH